MSVFAKKIGPLHLLAGIPVAVGLGYMGSVLYPRLSDTVASGADRPSSTYGFDTPKPDDFLERMQKDGIPAIWEPSFVSPSSANMPDSAHVIGVEINGESHAYSINLLDSYEIVNDIEFPFL